MAFLTAYQMGLLKEIYEVPANGSLVIAGENEGVPASYLPLSGNLTVSGRLSQAFDDLASDPDGSARVAKILAVYEQFALDPSNIDRNGYQFRQGKSMKTIYKSLMPYTGIMIMTGQGLIVTPLG